MADLMFAFSSPAPGLRHWDLRGPAGVIRFEIADALGFQTSSTYLHATNYLPGTDVGDCDVCGGGYHDALVNELSRGLRERWSAAGCDDNVIRVQLERWYHEELSTPPVPVSEGSQVSGEVGPGGSGPNLAAAGAGNGGVVPVPVAAQPRYVLDAPAILDMVGRYAAACVKAATTGSPKGREDAREQIRDLWDAIRAALTPVPDVEPDADEPHLIEFRATGWTIQHPLTCRPKLFDCPVNRVAESELTAPPAVLGVFEVSLNDIGDRLLIGDRVDEPQPRWGSGPLVDHNPETPAIEHEGAQQ